MRLCVRESKRAYKWECVGTISLSLSVSLLCCVIKGDKWVKKYAELAVIPLKLKDVLNSTLSTTNLINRSNKIVAD